MFIPKLGTMHRRNRLSTRVVTGLLLSTALVCWLSLSAASAYGQIGGSAPPPGGQGANAPPPAPEQPSTAPQNQPANQAPAQGQTPPAQPPGNPQAPADYSAAPSGQNGSGSAQPPDASDNGVFVFHAEAKEVVLHATVLDERNHLIMNLTKPDFTVYENDKPQQVKLFRQEDFPVAMGIVIDNSGSMREKRDEVNKAAINLVRSSNPDDQVFVVNFNDEYYLDQDFTSNVKLLQTALEHVETRGGTA